MATNKDRLGREMAKDIVAVHGANLTIEKVNMAIKRGASSLALARLIGTKLWGKRMMVFTPGRLVFALEIECDLAGGELLKAFAPTASFRTVDAVGFA